MTSFLTQFYLKNKTVHLPTSFKFSSTQSPGIFTFLMSLLLCRCCSSELRFFSDRGLPASWFSVPWVGWFFKKQFFLKLFDLWYFLSETFQRPQEPNRTSKIMLGKLHGNFSGCLSKKLLKRISSRLTFTLTVIMIIWTRCFGESVFVFP